MENGQRNKTPQYKIKSFIDKFNLEKFINVHGQEYKEASSKDNPQFILHDCPYCHNINYKGNEHPWRFYINKLTKQFICYNCSQNGSIFHLLSVFEKITIRQVFDKYFSKDFIDLLPQQLADQINNMQITASDSVIPEVILSDEFRPIFEGKHTALGLKYLIERGIKSKETINALDIRYCEYCEIKIPDKKPIYIQKRVVFPVYSDNKVVGWQARCVTGLSPLKYYISDNFPKRKIIYNYKNIYNAETVIICEGIFDALKVWKHNPIVIFGKSLSAEQLVLLQKMPNLKNVIVGLDADTKIPDKLGNISYDKLVKVLKNFWNVYEINLGNHKDLGELTTDEADEMIENAYPHHDVGLTILI